MRALLIAAILGVGGCSLLLSGAPADELDASVDADPSPCSACVEGRFCDDRISECVTCDRLYRPDQVSAPDLACPSGVCDRARQQCAQEFEVAYVRPGVISSRLCERATPCATSNAQHGVFVEGTDFLIQNTVIASNQTHGFVVRDGLAGARGTFRYNTVAGHGGDTEIRCPEELDPPLANVFAVDGNLILPATESTNCAAGDTFVFNRSYIPGYEPGIGNLDTTAMPDVDPETFEFRGVGAGVDVGVLSPIDGGDFDLAGNPRVSGTAPDVGAFELQQ